MTIAYSELHPGRWRIGRFENGRDLVTELEALFPALGVPAAAFTVRGGASVVTVGAFDQQQQVFVTHRESGSFHIVSCSGTVCNRDGTPFVLADALFSDLDGRLIGGRVFSETRLVGGEFELRELSGGPLSRDVDPETGMILWQLSFGNR